MVSVKSTTYTIPTAYIPSINNRNNQSGANNTALFNQFFTLTAPAVNPVIDGFNNVAGWTNKPDQNLFKRLASGILHFCGVPNIETTTLHEVQGGYQEHVRNKNPEFTEQAASFQIANELYQQALLDNGIGELVNVKNEKGQTVQQHQMTVWDQIRTFWPGTQNKIRETIKGYEGKKVAETQNGQGIFAEKEEINATLGMHKQSSRNDLVSFMLIPMAGGQLMGWAGDMMKAGLILPAQILGGLGSLLQGSQSLVIARDVMAMDFSNLRNSQSQNLVGLGKLAVLASHTGRFLLSPLMTVLGIQDSVDGKESLGSKILGGIGTAFGVLNSSSLFMFGLHAHNSIVGLNNASAEVQKTHAWNAQRNMARFNKWSNIVAGVVGLASAIAEPILDHFENQAYEELKPIIQAQQAKFKVQEEKLIQQAMAIRDDLMKKVKAGEITEAQFNAQMQVLVQTIQMQMRKMEEPIRTLIQQKTDWITKAKWFSRLAETLSFMPISVMMLGRGLMNLTTHHAQRQDLAKKEGKAFKDNLFQSWIHGIWGNDPNALGGQLLRGGFNVPIVGSLGSGGTLPEKLYATVLEPLSIFASFFTSVTMPLAMSGSPFEQQFKDLTKNPVFGGLQMATNFLQFV
jgi:hypothetical protein